MKVEVEVRQDRDEDRSRLDREGMKVEVEVRLGRDEDRGQG